MTPDAVLHRYTELLARRPVDTAALADLVCLDAPLLAAWCRLLGCSPSRLELGPALATLDANSVPELGLGLATLVVPGGDAERPSLESWGGALANASLGAALAPLTPVGQTPDEVRGYCLLALAGESLQHDALLVELLEYRDVSSDLLLDTHPLIALQAVVREYHGGDEGAALEAAQLLLGIGQGDFVDALGTAADATDLAMREAQIAEERYDDWLASLWVQLQMMSFTPGLARATTPDALYSAHRLCTRTLFGAEPLLLVHERADAVLRVVNPKDLTPLSLRLDAVESKLARCARERVEMELQDHASTVVAERQLLRRLNARRGQALPLVYSGELLGVLLFGRDDPLDAGLAQRRAYAQTLAEWLARRSGGDSGRRLGDFQSLLEKRLRELVHEANNPLSVVRNTLHLLAVRLENDAATVSQLELIEDEVRRAGDVFRQVASVPTDVQAETAVHDSEFELNALLQGLVDLYRAQAEEQQVKLQLEIPAAPIALVSDRDRLTQLLTNLLRNALEAQPDGGELTLGADRGVYRGGRAGLELWVRDSGPGLPAAVLTRLFEPKSSSKGAGHQGLGLHLVKRLADELGMDVDVRQPRSGGSEFTLFLPHPG